MMTSARVALPTPAFQSVDMPYTFSQEGGDGHHHVKVFVRVEATSAELVTHAHFASLKPGWGQFDAAGEEMEVGPFSKRSILSPARLNHYRTRSLQEWTTKVNKRSSGSQGNVGNVYGAIDSLDDLRGAITLPDAKDSAVLDNIIARQGCL
ncbi:hypothetical protein KFL_005430040 [Klebsormidium nitens]|uniref:Uncharacterized protein n=1 Tax=Klebsormidium nitens TaxID=105231 RepID=A0A1Y1IJJ2_KLENI|nr:hypothetical protein KFL_005430040 [Klebsormidium nitens]|eukprot:GAQ89619.1 hypothetical protein KFL_005430040 [Klebsormidium nitens]